MTTPRETIIEAGAKGVFQSRERRMGVTTQEVRFPAGEDKLDANAALDAMLPLIKAALAEAVDERRQRWMEKNPDQDAYDNAYQDGLNHAARLIEGWTP